MLLDDYQEAAKATALYPEQHKLVYSVMGLAGEAGELCNKLKKHLRGDAPLDKAALADELGDALWYVAAVATDLGVSLAGVASQNIVKLAARRAAGTLQGSGDAR